MAPQLIISAVTSKTQDGNITNSGNKILTSGPHVRLSSYYYVGLNEVTEMTDFVSPKSVHLCSKAFSFTMNPNRDKK